MGCTVCGHRYFLQMSECQWPDHVFIADAKTFRLCMYHKDPSKKAASLYCVTNDQDPYPVSIELLNNKGRVIRESKGCSNRYKKKLWSIISASTDFRIKHSYCEFSIKFESLPPYYDQPLRFRFKSKSTNPKIPKIEPFTTREFRVVYVDLLSVSPFVCTTDHCCNSDDGSLFALSPFFVSSLYTHSLCDFA